MNKTPDNAAAMVRQRQQDSRTKRRKVLDALDAMERTRCPITVADVARRAGVSSWLVRQEPLLEAVRQAQARLSQGNVPSAEPARPSAGSLHIERDLLRQENQRLRHQLRMLQSRLSELLGDHIEGTDLHSQHRLVQELTDQNTALTRQTGEAIQQTHQLQQKVDTLSSDLQAAHNVNRSLMAELNRPSRSRADLS